MRRLFTLMIAVLLLTAPHAAKAMSPPILSFGCAPWDGQTLDMNIAAPDALYQVQIWGKGMDDLEKGQRTIVIDGAGGDPDGTGRASVLPSAMPGAAPNKVALTVHFDELHLKDGGIGAGYLELHDGTKIPFHNTISGAQICG